MSAATEKTKPIKKKVRPMYSDDVKKKVVQLFSVEHKTPKQITEELKTIFPNQKMPKIKACRRYIRAGGFKIGQKA